MTNCAVVVANEKTGLAKYAIKLLTLQHMKNVSLYIDIVFCLLVLPVMAMIFPVERWYHNFPGYVVAVAAWLYGVYVLNRSFTVPSLFAGGRKALTGTAVIALSLAVTFCLSSVSLYTPKPNIHDQGIVRVLPYVQQYQQAVWSLFMIVVAFSFAVGLLTQTNKQRARSRAVEAERDRAEIELYKAQIKPHFMFNTLNSLYGLFLTRNEHALESLEKFIAMMRYIHTSSLCDMAPLAEEADYIRRYVDLQKLRLSGMTTVVLDISINDPDLRLPPMLLVTFVENCFKHGISPVERSEIRISLTESDKRMTFSTVNRIFPVKRIGEHMGINNCRKRLELLYPGHHRLTISDDGEFYKVELFIELTV